MRFSSPALLLLALRSLAVTVVESSTVTYVKANRNDNSKVPDLSPPDPQRELRFVDGVTPGVDIYYDGTTASCPPPDGTGRRFDASPTTDPDCGASGEDGWDLFFKLDLGDVQITSCPHDKVLKMIHTNKVTVDYGIPTPGDKAFLMNTQKDLLNQPQVHDKDSLVALSANAMELLNDWPPWLGLDYNFADVMFVNDNYQRNVVVIGEDSMETIHEKPAEKLVYSDYYNSLCFATGKYVKDANGDMGARVDGADAPLSCAGDTDMLVSSTMPLSDPADCTPTPVNATDADVAWASGNCMGRCGAGCGAHPNSLAQYTNDCLDYDYCVRFNVDRDWPGSCANEFLYTIEDTLWSGSCDMTTKMEEVYDPCGPGATAPPPTPAPVAPAFPLKPVVVTAIEAGNCNDACAAASGSWECTPQSLAEQSYRFEYPNILNEALQLGIPCTTFDITDGLGSTTPYIEYLPDTGDFKCWASQEDRGEITPLGDANFDCSASAGPNELRLCTCYIA